MFIITVYIKKLAVHKHQTNDFFKNILFYFFADYLLTV